MLSDKKWSWFDWLNGFGMLILCVLTIYPFLYVISISLSSPAMASLTGLHLYPREFQVTAYMGILHDSQFMRSYLNIIIVTVAGTFLGMLISSCAAYTLSKAYYPFRKTITFLLFFTVLFNGGIIPYYLVIKDLGLIDTWIPLWIGSMTGIFIIVVLKNFFLSLPEEMTEAAKIDGASDFTVFLRIVIPLSKPVLATVGLWLAVALWNDWFTPYIFINNPDKMTLPYVLRKYVVENDLSHISSFNSAILQGSERPTPKQLVAAVITLAMLPLLLAYPFIQRFFVQGVILGSVKE